jgi:hypothetical protein
LRIISKNYKDIYLKQEINIDKEKFISKNLVKNIQNNSVKVEANNFNKNSSEENNNLNSDFFG